MAELFNIQHESDLAEYTATVTDGGDLSQGTPGLASTVGRMEVLVDDANQIYGRLLFVLTGKSDLRVRFYIDPNGITMSSGDAVYVMYIQATDPWALCSVYLQNDGSNYEIYAWVKDDAGTTSYIPAAVDISNAEHYVEFHVERATSDIAGDGRFRLWVDGNLEGTIIDQDFDAVFENVDNIRTGAPAYAQIGDIDGTYYLDEFVGNDDGTEIGPVAVSGEVTWGHDTGVLETNILDFSGNWTGTGSIISSGDDEQICLDAGEYMESNIVNTGAYTVTLYQNLYDGTGDDVVLKYRHGATEAACAAAGWNAYTVPFVSAGYVQVRLEATP